MRRLIIVEPLCRAAIWSRRFAVFGLLLAGMAVVASRGGAVDPPGAMAVLGAALLFAVLALLSALIAAGVIWRTGHRGIGATLGSTVLACVLLAYPVWLAEKAARLPAISDVSTDPADPLPFSRDPKIVAGRRGMAYEAPSQVVRQIQLAAYPDVKPVTLDLLPADAYKAALKLVTARRWTVLEAQPPAGRPAVGHIEAVAKSPIMGFPDDLTVRLAAFGTNQTRVDMRSASRFGHRDLGVNASRIEAFMSDLEDAADEE